MGTIRVADAAPGALSGTGWTFLGAIADWAEIILVSAFAGENFALISPPNDSIRESPAGLSGWLDPLFVEAPPVNRTTMINPTRPSSI